MVEERSLFLVLCGCGFKGWLLACSFMLKLIFCLEKYGTFVQFRREHGLGGRGKMFGSWCFGDVWFKGLVFGLFYGTDFDSFD